MFASRTKAGKPLPGPLSIWDPVHLGIDEHGKDVCVGLAERNLRSPASRAPASRSR